LPEPAAAAYRTALASVDLSDVLPRIELETIVSARLGSIISHASVEVAGLIPGARLVVTGDGYHRPKLGRQLRELLEADVPENFRPSAFQTILFTDLESSTALTQRVGDDAAQDVLRGHNATVRAALEAHGGREVKHTGDGIMAAFPSAVRAVEAALQIQRDLAGGEVRVRMGLNAGEPISEDDDLFGTAVQLARRICDRADPGQVLVSRVVADLCAGKRLQFRHHSDATLKGFGEPVALYEVGQSDKVA
jgi:class 3 adenylate cyclase